MPFEVFPPLLRRGKLEIVRNRRKLGEKLRMSMEIDENHREMEKSCFIQKRGEQISGIYLRFSECLNLIRLLQQKCPQIRKTLALGRNPAKNRRRDQQNSVVFANCRHDAKIHNNTLPNTHSFCSILQNQIFANYKCLPNYTFCKFCLLIRRTSEQSHYSVGF